MVHVPSVRRKAVLRHESDHPAWMPQPSKWAILPVPQFWGDFDFRRLSHDHAFHASHVTFLGGDLEISIDDAIKC